MPKKKRGRPKQYDNLKATLNLNYPKEWEKKVIEFASKRNISKSEFVREAIDYYVKNYDEIQESKESRERLQLTDDDILSLRQIMNHCHKLDLIPTGNMYMLNQYVETYRGIDSKYTRKLALKEIYNLVKKRSYIVEEHIELKKILEKIADVLGEK